MVLLTRYEFDNKQLKFKKIKEKIKPPLKVSKN